MGDLTLGDRVLDLEVRVRDISLSIVAMREWMDEKLSGVVLVEKRRPGPAVRSVSKRLVARGPRGGVSRKGPKIRKGFVPQEIVGLTKPWKEAGA